MAFPRVSDLRRFTRLSRRPFTLLLAAMGALVVSIVFGRLVAPRIDMQIASVAIAFGLVTIQALLILLSAYLLGMAVAVFSLGTTWRDTHLLKYTPESTRNSDAYLSRVADKTLIYWAIVVAMLVVSTVGVHITTGKYFLNFPTRGYHLVSFRGESPVGQIRAMREIVRRDLTRYIDPDDLRERMRVHLASEHDSVRAQAAWMTGRAQMVSLETSVRQLLQHSNAEVRAQAAIAEGQLRTDKGIDALGVALENERNEDVLEALLIAVGLARDTHIAEDIAQRLHTFSDKNRPIALWAIGESEALCVGDEVIRYTGEDHDHDTRCAAMESMKKIGTLEQSDALRDIFRDEDDWCQLRVWYGRSSDPIQRDFHRMIVSGERFHEKALDALFNIAGPGLKEELAAIVNDPRQGRLNRKHARTLYNILDPAHPRTARKAKGCDNPSSPGGAP